ncbi:Heterokaryon incompatibility protein 6 OR allele [Lachnellula suecica]|uniref:Heterokaryon incompatibility protein 6 OR allele n=1 Tax=Lachnellula suecica TaxID=602035 RepID=A0A8T9C0B2_9HELO|nr:Heterokaryon incompatibility protein 6 OR allele [Lachnellula suecica]
MASSRSVEVSDPYLLLPLDKAKREIRLINFTLENNVNPHDTIDLDRPIHCTFMTASLESPPTYTALSYVWGKSDQSRSVKIQLPKALEITATGQAGENLDTVHADIDITDNLHLALIHLRHSHLHPTEQQPRILLWIDALCINQKDPQEKSWQIQMIRDIYKSAKYVDAWLGPIPNHMSDAIPRLFWLLNDIGKEGWKRFGRYASQPLSEAWNGGKKVLGFFEPQLMEWMKNVHLVDEMRSTIFDATDGEYAVYKVSREALRWLLNLSYWRRIWILQEVFLARNIWFRCGFCVSHDKILHTAISICGKVAQVLGAQNPLSFDHRPFTKLCPPSQTNNMSLSPMLDWRYRDEDFNRRLIDLLMWNAKIGALQASEPVDHVFGLLGMASDAESLGFEPDYAKTCSEIFTAATMRDLPSWVPDWPKLSKHKLTSIWQLHDQPGMQLVHNRFPRALKPYTVSNTSNGSILKLGGRIISHIDRKLLNLQSSSSEIGILQRIWSVQLRLLALKPFIEKHATAYHTKEDRHFAFASTLVSGGFDRGRRIHSDNPSSLERIVSGYNALLNFDSTNKSFTRLFQRLIATHTLVLSSIRGVDGMLKSAESMPKGVFSYFDPPYPANPIACIFRHFFQDISKDPLAQIMAQNATQVKDQRLLENVFMFLDRAEDVNRGRACFFTAEGYLCLAPQASENGDLVVRLDGALVPFVLRPTGDGGFRLLGEAYVFGLMDCDDRAEEDLPAGTFKSPETRRTVNARKSEEWREFSLI